MPEDWDASTYDRIADPQTRWGRAVLERLPLGGDESVLDAGCGTGRVTEHLLARLPHGRVVALDASDAMLAEAARRLAWAGDRVTFVRADLTLPLPLDAPVDAAVSTATFHWVPDHDALFANLAAVLRPGGALVAQCGGTGNVASVIAAAAEVGHPLPPGRAVFAGPEETARRLQASGFRDIWVWLQQEPTPFEPGEPFETFLATVVLRESLAGLAEAERRAVTHEVAVRLPGAEVDYVRLNILARRGPAVVADGVADL
jgi:trans-aconitate 2-methyltransferase